MRPAYSLISSARCLNIKYCNTIFCRHYAGDLSAVPDRQLKGCFASMMALCVGNSARNNDTSSVIQQQCVLTCCSFCVPKA